MPGDEPGFVVTSGKLEVIGYSVATVSRPLSAKLHLDLALGDSGNRDGEVDYVGGAFPASNLRPLGIVRPNEPMKDF